MITSTNNTAEDFYTSTIYVLFFNNLLSQLYDQFIKHNNLLQSFRCILPGYKIYSTIRQDIKFLFDTYQEDLNNSDLVITEEVHL